MTKSILPQGLLILCVLVPFLCNAQITFNANTQQPPAYNGTFRIGMNMGQGYPSYNTDEKLATLSYSVGSRTLRPQLPQAFVKQWGYNIRTAAFNHYKNTLGMQDITCMIGMEASPDVRATEVYPCGSSSKQSLLFKDMYLPIWDNGANGTPYNENNPYAAYLYNLVSTYKSYIKFWEVWNEPGLDYANKGWRNPGDPAGNWWDTNPNPCDYKLQAPITHYIRLLRISYEIVKYLDPTAYVGPSSCGYPSFLDAILRNTDNPVDGSVTTAYPLKGGAYFDVLCHHAYPHFDGSVRMASTAPPYYIYTRHTDAAAEGLELVINNFEKVYNTRGYNGTTYPKKKWLISECNVPRQSFSPNQFGEVHNFGSDEVQRNFWAKAWVKACKIGVLQIHPYALVERKTPNETAGYEFDRMGMFKLGAVGGDPTAKTDGAISLNTTTLQLGNTTYNAARTAAMNLPITVNGAAFLDATGNYTYVLWAKTIVDLSENVTATYTFPTALNVGTLTKRTWDNSTTNTTITVNSTSIALTATPIFLTPTIRIATKDAPNFSVNIAPNPFDKTLLIDLITQSNNDQITVELMDISGRLLLTKKVEIQEKTTQIGLNTEGVNAGIYILRLANKEGILQKKVVKN
jgi:Secretion system C-terminal sorting domain